MDFSPSDEQVMLRDSAERFVREHYALETRRKLIASADGFSAENWRLFADLGWLGLLAPEEAGGLGGSFVDLAILLAALSRGLVLEPYIPTVVLGGSIIGRAGRTDLLSGIADGSLRFALAHEEAGERFDLHRTRATTAERTSDGYRLSGVKTDAMAAPSAQYLIVSATIPGEAGYALFLVDPKLPGVTLKPYLLVDGVRAADLVLDRVTLPANALLVGSQDAADVLEEAVDRTTLAYLAEAVGSMEASLQICSEYLKGRQQFGQPIGKFQALQHIMAEMFVEAQEARSILYQGLSQIDGEPADRRHAVSAAKIVVCQAAQIVSRQAIQLHGGYGITDEYAVSHHFRRQLVIEKSFGDIEYHAKRYL
jgi:alkylation response protein AidB-like acyl-CoA dehydrogenase